MSPFPVESHPLRPFLPERTQVLMLGSFPPKRERWSMDFFYPNFNNDMWRILGQVFYGDRHRFIAEGGRRFDRPRIEAFCRERGIALYDTASEVRRLRDNASDKYLEVVTPTDLTALLARIPGCRFIVTTGEKATETLCSAFPGTLPPPVGDCSLLVQPHIPAARRLRLYRMPSSSRAYPLSLERKAACYETMFRQEGMLP